MSRYQPYSSYKESGVEWLGRVPEHWYTKSLKYFAKLNPPKSEVQKLRNKECSFIPMEKLKTGSIELDVTKQIDEVYDGYTYFQNDDVLLAKVTPCFENRNIAIASDLHGGIGFGSSEIYVIRASKYADRRYLYYALQDETFMKLGISHMTGTGGLKRVPSEFLNNAKFPFPQIPEQTAIANFLDRETAKIDTLIAKQEHMIELLNEKRSALISHAVTKGIDPNVKMKDSGIEWLGEVPEHWEISPLKYLLSESLMYGANESADRDDPNDPRYIRITDIKSDGTLHAHTFKSLPMTIAEPYLLKTGAILLARSGATVGKSFLYDESWGIACFAGYLIKAAINQSKAFARFVYYFTMTPNYWQWLASAQIQATIENVSAEKYASLTIPLPSLSEQENILNYLDTKTTKIDTLIAKACQAIDLMKERRTALISAAVTGKIDVRKIA